MRRMCCYCGVDLESGLRTVSTSEPITHGICRECLREAMAGLGLSMDEFLDTLGPPVFVVDDQGRVIGANRPARAMVSKSIDTIRGRLGGEVFDCIHASEPGGCGGTVHCRSCVIRNTVSRTQETGEAGVRVPACQDLDTVEGPRGVRFHISTQKVGNSVLLRIDEAEPDSEAEAGRVAF